MVALLTLSLSAWGVEAKSSEMKLICYNIEYGMRCDTTENKEIFAQWVREQDPDILTLQEVNYFTQKSLEKLAKSYGHPYAIICKEGGFPTAITSKYPIVNVQKCVDNRWHGVLIANVMGYNVVSLHLSPHQYQSRWEDIEFVLETIRQSENPDKWILTGDFNSISPLDAEKYADGKQEQRLRSFELKNPKQRHLVDGKLDFSTQQRILDFGFIDGQRGDSRFSFSDFGARIDFIYISKDQKRDFIEGDFITDSFTTKYSDHKPIYIILKDKK